MPPSRPPSFFFHLSPSCLPYKKGRGFSLLFLFRVLHPLFNCRHPTRFVSRRVSNARVSGNRATLSNFRPSPSFPLVRVFWLKVRGGHDPRDESMSLRCVFREMYSILVYGFVYGFLSLNFNLDRLKICKISIQIISFKFG